MRQINKFRYYGKEFLCGDILVKDYYDLLINPKETTERLLLEFNDELPELNYRQSIRFQLILLDRLNELENLDKTIETIQKQSEQSKKNDVVINDFHIWVMILGKIGQPYDVVMNMPYKVFVRTLKDLDVINGKVAYDPKRHSERIDSAALKKVFGNSNTL